jgi:hypothetical protein
VPNAEPSYLDRSLQVWEGYVEGLKAPLELSAKGWKQIAEDPLEAGRALWWGGKEVAGKVVEGWGNILSSPGETWDALVWGGGEVLSRLQEILQGDLKEAGKDIGEGVMMTILTPGGGEVMVGGVKMTGQIMTAGAKMTAQGARAAIRGIAAGAKTAAEALPKLRAGLQAAMESGAAQEVIALWREAIKKVENLVKKEKAPEAEPKDGGGEYQAGCCSKSYSKR